MFQVAPVNAADPDKLADQVRYRKKTWEGWLVEVQVECNNHPCGHMYSVDPVRGNPWGNSALHRIMCMSPINGSYIKNRLSSFKTLNEFQKALPELFSFMLHTFECGLRDPMAHKSATQISWSAVKYGADMPDYEGGARPSEISKYAKTWEKICKVREKAVLSLSAERRCGWEG
eukprot:comp23114_c0_seq2/m.37222 comp23114_c0_seq2/g.37222  ORF comp23114_c0_seq2/g.37222 comp23114_c0_seq2/m.37222 type:complete len:174 (+) comp23114_c0_seq2:108-629(+)